jgi:predicted nucleic acid-binding protein
MRIRSAIASSLVALAFSSVSDGEIIMSAACSEPRGVRFDQIDRRLTLDIHVPKHRGEEASGSVSRGDCLTTEVQPPSLADVAK